MSNSNRQRLYQIFRVVYKDRSIPSAIPNCEIIARYDSSIESHIILWDDILETFPDALSVRHRTRAVNFEKGSDFKMYERDLIESIY
jgi:hypothetical protein